MPGLSFLSKKSWHTSNLNNQEKVWMAEQKKAAEEAKMKELAKQIQQEREKAEMERITGKKSMDTGIDWMYQGTAEVEAEQEKKEAEEYLLGKEFKASSSKAVASGEFAESARDEELFLKQRTSYQGHVDHRSCDANEEFVRKLEDPMHMVSQVRKQVMDEQMKKASLMQKVMRDTDANFSRDESTSRRDRRHHSRDRDRKKKKRKHRSRRLKSRERYRSRSSSRDRPVEIYDRRNGRSRERKYEREKAYNDRERHSRYMHNDKRTRETDFESCNQIKKLGGREYHDVKIDQSENHTDIMNKRYGLQGSYVTNIDDIGPDEKVLAKKMKDHLGTNDVSSRKRRKALTREEKEKRLMKMQLSAQNRDKDMEESLKKTNDNSDIEITGKALFLSSMTSKANEISMKDRIASKRHTNQKFADNASFL